MENTPSISAAAENDRYLGGWIPANTLKLIAIVAMLIDHISAVFLDQSKPLAIAMRFVGRITGPTMFYFTAVGYRHTRNANRYTLRLAIFAVVSYIPFIYCFTGQLPNGNNFLRLNVIYTILLGLLCIRARHEIENPVLRWAVIGVLFILSTPGDWYYMAPLMMLTFDFFYDDLDKMTAAYCLVILGASSLLSYALHPFIFYAMNRQWDFSLWSRTISEFGMFVPILLLRLYNGEKGGGGAIAKWGFYVFYPGHLLLLGLIHQFLVG